jgi:hypothetical protein
LSEGGGKAYGYCGSGYALLFTDTTKIDLEKHQNSLQALGGHVNVEGFSRASKPSLSKLSTEFIKDLEKFS